LTELTVESWRGQPNRRYLIQHGANAAAVNQQGISAVESCPEEYIERIKELFVAVAVAKLTAVPAGHSEFSVGDRVRLRYATTEPAHGYQGVNPDDLLVVRAVEPKGFVVHVSFVDPSMLLRFQRDELCPVYDTSGVSITTSSSQATSLNMFDSDRESCVFGIGFFFVYVACACVVQVQVRVLVRGCGGVRRVRVGVWRSVILLVQQTRRFRTALRILPSDSARAPRLALLYPH
jgi:hypothetical protein